MPNIRGSAAKRSCAQWQDVALSLVWYYSVGMATLTVKATYSLDVETVRTLERLAKQWDTSKSEALRRAVRAAARSERVTAVSESTDALDRWQASLGLTAAAAAGWARHARAERRSAARKRGG
jgi:hypothetical protein